MEEWLAMEGSDLLRQRSTLRDQLMQSIGPWRDRETYSALLNEVDAVAMLETVHSNTIPILQENAIQDKVHATISSIDHQDSLTIVFGIALPRPMRLVHIDEETVDVPGRTDGYAVFRSKDENLFIDLDADSTLEDPKAFRLVCMEMRRWAPVRMGSFATALTARERAIDLFDLEGSARLWLPKMRCDQSIESKGCRSVKDAQRN